MIVKRRRKVNNKDFFDKVDVLFSEIKNFNLEEKISIINNIRIKLSEISPFKNEPIDCVLWMKNNLVKANDYNPNKVAPPEMKLLEISISEDGFTQPIVTWENNNVFEIVDGFHRNRVGKESIEINKRLLDYLPITVLNNTKVDRGDRIAATIRHNRARGKHQISAMSDIVVELKGRNWTNERIGKALGMEPDEILRLCQITGLSSLFSDQEFSKSWDIEDSSADFEVLDDDIEKTEEDNFRTINTDDKDRIFHTYDKWECFKAGFYETKKKGMTREQCEKEYSNFLSNISRFENALAHIIVEWKHSCEHYLTNSSMNRIAWLGQAAMCYETGIPAEFRGGFNLLTEEQQKNANESALKYLNKWLIANSRKEVSMSEALSDNQMDIY